MKPMGPIPPEFAAQAGMLTIAGTRADDWLAAHGSPLFVYDPAIVAARVARFRAAMPAAVDLHYAVKANPSPELLQILWDNGVTHYDVASIAEVRLVRATLPQATLCFMHPVKSPGAIREAYHRHGVKTFSLDSVEELEKIVVACRDEEGNAATDLRLCIRLRVSSEHAALSLAAKFG